MTNETQDRYLVLFDASLVATDIERATAFADAIGDLHIGSDEEAQDAIDTAAKVKAMREEIEERRFSFTRPLMAEKERWDKHFKPVETKLKESETYIKGEMTLYRRRQREAAERERAELEAAAQRAAEEGRQTDADAAIVAMESVPVKPWVPAGSSAQVRWHAEVTDFDALLKAVASGEVELNVVIKYGATPEPIIQANEKLLTKIAQATHAPSKIPGVRFYSVESTAVTSKR